MNDTNGNKKLQVLAVIDREDKPTIWRHVGVAFSNRDGSLTLYLDAFPIGTNKLQVREERERPATGAAPGGNGLRRDAFGGLDEAQS
ncbi:MAG TPA: hypothetical protein VFK85_13930 [Anaeromyxobacteraceae bacterium]|nr:hypothetical protein [Anaeromyxobacteraceae bacterium]